MKPALLVIDVQKQFFREDPDTKKRLDSAVEYIIEAVKLFRKLQLPVVYIQHMEEESGLVPGFEGFDLPDEFNVQAEDIRITKTYGNSFHKTSLENDLKKLDVDTLIATGYCAEYCVLSTYRGAYNVDMTPILLRGSLASGKAENITFVESINDIISLGALYQLLDK